MDVETKKYIDGLNRERIPWNRMFTAYGTAEHYNELLAVLARRMSVSREIGLFKKAHNLRVVQPARYQDVMKARLAEGSTLGLSEDFTQLVMQAIHEESVRQQLDILNN